MLCMTVELLLKKKAGLLTSQRLVIMCSVVMISFTITVAKGIFVRFKIFIYLFIYFFFYLFIYFIFFFFCIFSWALYFNSLEFSYLLFLPSLEAGIYEMIIYMLLKERLETSNTNVFIFNVHISLYNC